MAVTQIATIEPISVEDAKEWLIDYADDQDDVIAKLIKAARLKIEKRCGISIAMKQYSEKLSGFPDRIELSYPPVISVDSIKYLNLQGVEETINPSDYQLVQDDYSPFIFHKTGWPTEIANRPDAVHVIYTTGIDIEDSPPDEVPEDLLQAMRWLIGHFAENREAVLLQPTRQEVVQVPDTVAEILAPYVVMRL